jgi:cell division protein FtsX
VRAVLGDAYESKLSLAMAGVRRNDSASVESARAWIERTQPRITAISTETAIRQVEERLSYFRQLAFVLGAISLGIGFLLVSTLVTLSVNERRGEIAVLRAIGTQTRSVLLQVMLEGAMLSGAGVAGGLLLGVIEQFSGVYLPDGFKDAMAYLVLIGVLILWPRGLLGEAHGRRV